LGHYLMRMLIRALFREQAQAARDPEDVNVYWEDPAIAGEQQRTGRCFRTDSLEACEKPGGFVERSAAEKSQIERAAAVVNLIQQRFDSDGLLAGEASRSNCSFYRGSPGTADLVPIGESGFQIGISAARVLI
jgi:hypothetical protein